MSIVKWETPSKRCGFGRKMNINEISINYAKKGGCAITFNQLLNEEIEKRNLSHMSIQQEDTTGEIYLVLNCNDGIVLTKTGGYKTKREEKKSYNYRICSKLWVTRLMKELSLPISESRTVIRITDNLAKKEDCMTFRIIPLK